MSGTIIERVIAWEAMDSRGRPTVSCRVQLAGGSAATATVPSGASAGSHEASELRDGGTRYWGKGTLRAVSHVNEVLGPLVQGADSNDHGAVDQLLADADGSPGFRWMGANAVLAVSLATLRAGAQANGVSVARWLNGDGVLQLPMPMVNIISGGAHAGRVIDVQDFLVIPVGASSFAQAIEWCADVREATQKVALNRGYREAVLVADEGGLALPLPTNRSALELLTEGIEAAGYDPQSQVNIALDVAATELYADGSYRFASENRRLSSQDLIAEIGEWCDDFPIASVEDPLAEDDWAAWSTITAQLGDRIELIGDDLFVTSESRLARGIDDGVANAVLVKVNQNGLVSGARSVLDAAQRAGYRTVVSARSGDTEDSWLVDLAVGWRAGQIKVGSTHRSERTSKWNRLLELEATEDTVFSRFAPRAR